MVKKKHQRYPHLQILRTRALHRCASHCLQAHEFWLIVLKQPVISNNIAKEDEAAAMAAMFQAQTANWEETQEKMSQSVLPSGAFCLRSSAFLMNIYMLFFPLSPSCLTRKQRATNLHKSTRNCYPKGRETIFTTSPRSTSTSKLCLLSVRKERSEETSRITGFF